MNVIRMIKLFGWERKMNNRLAEKRDDELRYQRKRQLLVLLSGTITCAIFLHDHGTFTDLGCSYSIPVIAMAACFACYVSELVAHSCSLLTRLCRHLSWSKSWQVLWSIPCYLLSFTIISDSFSCFLGHVRCVTNYCDLDQPPLPIFSLWSA